MIKHPDQRVGVFVDVQNMYHSAKNLYKAKVNFGKILEIAVSGRKLIRAIAYVIRSQSKEEEGFFEALELQHQPHEDMPWKFRSTHSHIHC